MELWWEKTKDFDSGIADIDDLESGLVGGTAEPEPGMAGERSLGETLEAIEGPPRAETPGRLTGVGARATQSPGARGGPPIDPDEAERELVEDLDADRLDEDILREFDL